MAIKTKTNQVNTWEEKLVKEAEISAGQESAASGGQFFSLRAGMLKFDGAAMPGNQIACIVIDSILENVYYPGAFDPENPTPPKCFAFGRIDEHGDLPAMEPHEIVVEKQSEQCSKCPWAQWGTKVRADGSKSRGKACSETRRLAIIIAGNFVGGQFQPIAKADAPEHFANAKVGYMKLPVTSVKNYAGYVRSCKSAFARPPYAMYTRIWLTPNADNQFDVNFEALGKVPSELQHVIEARHEQAMGEIAFPYQPAVEPEPVQKGKAALPPKRKKY